MKTSVNFELVKKQFPSLGRLSVSILAGKLEKYIGKEAVDELRSPLKFLEEQEKLADALMQAEKRFLDECPNDYLRGGLLNLRTSDLPSLYDAFSNYAQYPDDQVFRKFLQDLLKRDFPILTSGDIEEGADLYLRSLRLSLIYSFPDSRERIVAVTLQDIRDILQTMQTQHQTATHGPLNGERKRVGLYPQLPPLLVGREHDMVEIRRKLGFNYEMKSGIQCIVSVRGWPGVGKTTFISAVAFDEEIGRAFPDGVLFTSLGQEPNIGTELMAWLRAIDEQNVYDRIGIEETKSRLSARLKDKRMLLLIDDVWQSEHTIPFLIGGPECAAIITTREQEIASQLSPVPELIYKLQVLSEEAALKLLTLIAPSVVQSYPEEARLLVKELEGLPLALRVAGNLLQEESEIFSVKELIKEIQDIALLLQKKAPAIRDSAGFETTPSVAALLQKSTDRLDEKTKRCFALLGLMAPKPATFGLDSMSIYWQVDDPKPIARILVKRGLLEYIPDLECFQMHALLVAHARSLFDTKLRSSRRRSKK